MSRVLGEEFLTAERFSSFSVPEHRGKIIVVGEGSIDPCGDHVGNTTLEQPSAELSALISYAVIDLRLEGDSDRIARAMEPPIRPRPIKPNVKVLM